MTHWYLLLVGLPLSAASDRHVKFTFNGATAEAKKAEPSPLLNFTWACGDWAEGRICDPYKRLTQEERAELGNATLEFAEETPCGCYERFCLAPGTHHGYHTAIVVSKEEETTESGQRLADDLLAAYAARLQVPEPRNLRAEAKHKGAIFGYCSDQSLILLARDRGFVARAYKVRGRVSAEEAAAAAEGAAPMFQSGRYAQGLKAMLASLRERIDESHLAQPDYALTFALVALILGATLGVWLWQMWKDAEFRRSCLRCCRRCGAKQPPPRRKFKMNFKVDADDFVEIDWRRHRERTQGALQESFLIPANHFRPK